MTRPNYEAAYKTIRSLRWEVITTKELLSVISALASPPESSNSLQETPKEKKNHWDGEKWYKPEEKETTCPVCASPVTVSIGDGGTGCYIPLHKLALDLEELEKAWRNANARDSYKPAYLILRQAVANLLKQNGRIK